MQLPRTPLAISFLMLAPFAGACTLPGKVCIGDCAYDMSAADTSQSETSHDEPATGSDESGGSTAPDPTATTGDETGAPPAMSCDIPDTVEPSGPGCDDGIPVAGEFCLFEGGGEGSPDLIVSSVHGQFDPGGEDLITVAPSGILTAYLDGPEPYADHSNRTWDPMLGAGKLELTGVGDFNEDGKLDVVGRIRGADVDDIIVFRADADGGLENAQILPFQHKILHGPAVADWNQDDHLDLVIVPNNVDTDDAVEFHQGDGSGEFVPSIAFSYTYPVDAPFAMGALGPDSVANDFVSFNAKKGLLDIHIQAPGDTLLSVDLGPQLVVHAIQIADLDDDGDGDIVVLGDDTDLAVTTLTVLLQDLVGDEPMFAAQSYGVDCGATTLAIGRIDGDAAPDIVIGSPASMTPMIRRNDGAGGFSTSTHAILDLGVDQLHVFDFSGDGFADIVGASSTTGMVTFVLNQP